VSYARNLLSRGEEVVFESRQHWFAVIARTWLWIIVAILAVAVLIFLTTNDAIGNNATLDGILTLVVLGGLLLSLVMIGLVVWGWRNQEWLITTRRVVRAEGVLNKNMSDSNLEKINDAMLSQSLFGRIFNYGTLDILTAAEEVGSAASLGDFPMLADPIDFKKAMLNQKELLDRPDLAPPRYQRSTPAPEMQRAEPLPPRAGSSYVSEVAASSGPARDAAPTPAPAPSGAAPPRAPGDVADTLERLATLRDKGLITPEEYEVKKRELLERM
jgi:hypothetical protein